MCTLHGIPRPRISATNSMAKTSDCLWPHSAITGTHASLAQLGNMELVSCNFCAMFGTMAVGQLSAKSVLDREHQMNVLKLLGHASN